MSVIALVSDLIFESKIRAVAGRAGVPVQTVRKLADVGSRMSGCKAVLLDLHVETEAVLEFIRKQRDSSPRPRIIVFLSHVERELAQQARDAGADEILPRSKFTRELEQILRRAAPDV